MTQEEIDALWQQETQWHTRQGHHVNEIALESGSRALTCEECNSVTIQLDDGSGIELTHSKPIVSTPS